MASDFVNSQAVSNTKSSDALWNEQVHCLMPAAPADELRAATPADDEWKDLSGTSPEQVLHQQLLRQYNAMDISVNPVRLWPTVRLKFWTSNAMSRSVGTLWWPGLTTTKPSHAKDRTPSSTSCARQPGLAQETRRSNGSMVTAVQLAPTNTSTVSWVLASARRLAYHPMRCASVVAVADRRIGQQRLMSPPS